MLERNQQPTLPTATTAEQRAEQRAGQRAAWRQARAALAKAQRTARHRAVGKLGGLPAIGPGMIRKDVTVTILRDGLARCPARACPVRYSTGEDRYCHDHAQDDGGVHQAAAELGIDLGQLAADPPMSRERAQEDP